MSESLIINVRRQLHWQRRLFSDAGTALLWGCWLWLFRPLFAVLSGLIGTGLGIQHSLLTALTLSGATSLENTALALLSTAGLLLLWNQLTTKLAQGQSPEQKLVCRPPDYAAHFGLSAAHVMRCRSNQFCVVHHDDRGNIARIELRGKPALPDSPAMPVTSALVSRQRLAA